MNQLSSVTSYMHLYLQIASVHESTVVRHVLYTPVLTDCLCSWINCRPSRPICSCTYRLPLFMNQLSSITSYMHLYLQIASVHESTVVRHVLYTPVLTDCLCSWINCRPSRPIYSCTYRLPLFMNQLSSVTSYMLLYLQIASVHESTVVRHVLYAPILTDCLCSWINCRPSRPICTYTYRLPLFMNQLSSVTSYMHLYLQIASVHESTVVRHVLYTPVLTDCLCSWINCRPSRPICTYTYRLPLFMNQLSSVTSYILLYLQIASVHESTVVRHVLYTPVLTDCLCSWINCRPSRPIYAYTYRLPLFMNQLRRFLEVCKQHSSSVTATERHEIATYLVPEVLQIISVDASVMLH